MNRHQLVDFIVKAMFDMQDDGPGIYEEIRERWPDLSRGEISDAYLEAAEAVRASIGLSFPDGRSLKEALEEAAWDILTADTYPPPDDYDGPPCPV